MPAPASADLPPLLACPAVGCVVALFAAFTAWLCLSAQQRPHQLEGPQLAAFRAATASEAAAPEEDDEGSAGSAPAAEPAPERAPAAGTACPICLSDVASAVQANCGHWYCGGCILSYWRHDSRGGGQLRCPCCRRGISRACSTTQSEKATSDGADVILFSAFHLESLLPTFWSPRGPPLALASSRLALATPRRGRHRRSPGYTAAR